VRHGQHTLDNLFEPFFTTKETGRGTGWACHGVRHCQTEQRIHQCLQRAGKRPVSGSICPAMGCRKRHRKNAWHRRRRGSGETILIVEDEPTILEMLEVMLESLNYTILPQLPPRRAMESWPIPMQARSIWS
jgi:hypothetical protein